jgi:23S rRNA (cytosine1962-C5)-methyltransferase
VYAQAVGKVEGRPEAGDLIDVLDPQDNWIGAGFFSPSSAIAARIVTRKPGEKIDRAFFADRIAKALAFRRDALGLPDGHTNGYRLVHSEGDGLSGLVADVYGDVAVVQLLTAGMKRREREILDALREVTGVRSVVEFASTEHVEKEGLPPEEGRVTGAPVEQLAFRERGFEFRLPLAAAQKTGFYFDQRENRTRLETLCAGKRVLDACSYVGAFSLAAARGGAREVLALDRSEGALAVAQDTAARSGLAERIRFQRGDLKRVLPELIEQGERFDVIVLDPPKLAHSVKHLERARKAYRAWNAFACSLCSEDAVLVTCSCSAAMQPHDFLRTLAIASADAKREASLFAYGEQAPDHPTPAAFDEGRYLKAAFLRVR